MKESLLYTKKKLFKFKVVAEFIFEIEADNYVKAFREAVSSISIEHKGYKGASCK